MSASRSLRFLAAALVWSATVGAQPPQNGRGGPQPEFMRQAQQALHDGKLDDALGVYQKELAANPNSPQANNAAGTVLDLMGKGADGMLEVNPINSSSELAALIVEGLAHA